MSDKIGKTNRPIPDDWRIESLKSVSLNGAKNGFFKKPELVGTGYKLVNVSELYQSFGIDTRVESVERVAATSADLAKFGVEEGDVFFTRSSLVLSGIAACNIVRQLWEPTLFECHVMKMSPDTSKMFPDFVAYCCRDSYSRRYLMAQAKQTTMTTISQPEIEQLPIPVAPLTEQKKIARILTTLDSLIEKTEALIAKYQAIKQGMMHDLFTRGVDSSGQLRPTQQQAPDLYKQSELGWIPKEWEVDQIENVLARIIDYRGKTPTKASNGVPLITAKNIRMGYIDENPQEFINERDYRNGMTRGIPQKGDVLFTTEAPLANVAQLDTDERRAFAQRVIILQCNERMDSDYLTYRLMTNETRSSIKERGSGSTVEGIKQSQFRLVNIAFPKDIDEQGCVANRLRQVDSQIVAEQRSLEKYRTIKSGLMQDLLTGKVRVKVDEAEGVAAHA